MWKRTALCALIGLLLPLHALATVETGGGSGGGGNASLLLGNSIANAGGFLSTTQPPARVVNTYSDTITAADAGTIIEYDYAGTVAVSIAAASTSGYTQGFGFTINNAGGAAVTLTPTTSTVNGQTSLAVAPGFGCYVYSDGANYQIDNSSCTQLSFYQPSADTLGASLGIGTNALRGLATATPGTYNDVIIGYDAANNLSFNGTNDSGIGLFTQANETSGSNNASNGASSLVNNTTGSYLTANGQNSLPSNTTGTANVGNGANALLANTTGNYNVGDGFYSCGSITTGSYNTCLGNDVGTSVLTTGSHVLLMGTSSAVTTPLANTSNYLNIENTITGNTSGGSQAIEIGAPTGGIPSTGLNSNGPLQVNGVAIAEGAVGDTRNLVMNLAANGNTATFTADQLVVATALNGAYYSLPSYSQALNVSTTGLGGMDTGVVPANGYVSVYAIYNPTTGTQGVVATNVTTSTASIYAGANLPAGYTGSALVAIIPTAASQLVGGYVQQRNYFYGSGLQTISASLAAVATLTSQSLSAFVPPGAVRATGLLQAAPTSGFTANPTVASNSSGLGKVSGGVVATTTVAGESEVNAWFKDVPLITAQTLYYLTSNSTSGPSGSLYISSYGW